ncbi:MAG TPA: hypothetical protein PK200_17490, partial [Spirochaetota bacterium]|nr:hypothetical protein [Spirochaetota bacterium]
MILSEHLKNEILSKRPYIKIEWIERILKNPYHAEVQEDGNHKIWGFIEEMNKFFRVVASPDRTFIITVFPDRNFTEKEM